MHGISIYLFVSTRRRATAQLKNTSPISWLRGTDPLFRFHTSGRYMFCLLCILHTQEGWLAGFVDTQTTLPRLKCLTKTRIHNHRI